MEGLKEQHYMHQNLKQNSTDVSSRCNTVKQLATRLLPLLFFGSQLVISKLISPGYPLTSTRDRTAVPHLNPTSRFRRQTCARPAGPP